MIDSYKKISVGQYLEIEHICADASLEEIDRQVKVLAILGETTEEAILDLPIADYTEMVRASRFLESPDDGDMRIAKEYRLGEFVLVPCTDYRKIRASQYIDFQEYAKGGEDNMVEMLSCFLLPKGKHYNMDYDVLDVQAAIRNHLSAHDVISLCHFFAMRYLQLIERSLTSSTREARRIPQKEKREMLKERVLETLSSMRNGVGLRT